MRPHRLFPVFAAFLVLWACGKEEPTPSPDDLMPKAPTEITLSASALTAAQAGETLTLDVKAPFVPRLSGLPSWVTASQGTFENYQVTLLFEVSANETYQERSAVITVASGPSLTKTVELKQPGATAPDPPAPGQIDPDLTNANASEAAKKVYSFLLDSNGNKMVSGVQAGGTANNNERLEQVYELTGKHPALSGYDFIFLQYSPTPSSWNWKVDYGDISAAREQWQKNGLVSYMWHWNVPSSQAAWEKGKDGDFSGYNFYSDKTSFSITNALTAGTWENDFILQDIEKVAGYLKLLQQEDIPVLWRPLHEAAGNYNVYGSNGAWFWWGRGGSDACKQLWILLREKLEGEYGLDNLIWVWTLDATRGAESQYADWYPGNDQVDIVGVDIYEENTDAKQRQYQAAVNLSGGHKMVTVSECGNIPDPTKCAANGEKWSWFMTWDLESYPLNTQAYWKQLMSSSRVLSREQMPSLK